MNLGARYSPAAHPEVGNKAQAVEPCTVLYKRVTHSPAARALICKCGAVRSVKVRGHNPGTPCLVAAVMSSVKIPEGTVPNRGQLPTLGPAASSPCNPPAVLLSADGTGSYSPAALCWCSHLSPGSGPSQLCGFLCTRAMVPKPPSLLLGRASLPSLRLPSDLLPPWHMCTELRRS